MSDPRCEYDLSDSPNIGDIQSPPVSELRKSMKRNTLTPKQLEVIGKITILPRIFAKFETAFDESTPDGYRQAAALTREAAAVMDEIADCLAGEGAEAFKEALTNV